MLLVISEVAHPIQEPLFTIASTYFYAPKLAPRVRPPLWHFHTRFDNHTLRAHNYGRPKSHQTSLSRTAALPHVAAGDQPRAE